MSGKVCKVERALYGRKQSGREWGFEAADALIANGYDLCRADQCVFRKMVDREVVGLIVIYVNYHGGGVRAGTYRVACFSPEEVSGEGFGEVHVI